MSPKIPPLKSDYVADEPSYLNDGPSNATVEVETPSGATLSLLTEGEADFYNLIAKQYQEDNKFTNISDLLELDRVLSLEVICFRQTTWTLQEEDYYGGALPKDIQRNIKDLSKEIRDIKSGLGIDKRTRDAGQGDSIADLMHNLKIRAKEFGIHRNEQIYQVWRNWNGLEAKITLYRNSTDAERTKFDCHIEDILAWCDERFEEMKDLDQAFQENQKIWIRDLN